MDQENKLSINEAPQRKYVYSVPQIAFAWLSLLLGYLVCRVYPAQMHPLGGFLLTVTAFVLTGAVLLVQKVKIPPMAVAAAIAAVVVSLGLILSENYFLNGLSSIFSAASYCYFLYAAQGNALENGFSNLIFADYFKALFLLPFQSLLRIFGALFQGKAKTGLKILGKIFAGICIAAIPTMIIFLLLSYDDGFREILDKLFQADDAVFASHLGSFLLGIPIGMYIFGLFFSSGQGLCRNRITLTGCRNAYQKAKILPQLTALTAIAPVLFLYVVFFISQWQYYISGFTGVLPEDFSYAEYARQGFFELCAVSVVNLVLLMGLVLFVKRGSKNNAPMLKLLSVVLCLFTLVLISTAVAKMVLYIDQFGLTQKRVYAMWLMVVIGCVYIIIAVGQFVPKIKPVAASATVCVVLFAALCLCNVRGMIAQYNVDRYLSGTLETVDLYAMEELEDSAIPALVRLAEETKEEQPEFYDELTEFLYSRAYSLALKEATLGTDIFDFTFPAYQARNALKDYWPEITTED